MIINSILDTDLYKISMGQSICNQYPDVDAEYTFIDRNKIAFPDGFAKRLQDEVKLMRNLRLTDSEYHWLRDVCYYLKRPYLDFLRGFRFDPSQVAIGQKAGRGDGELVLSVKGPWYQTVLWEVPLMAMISELYFEMTDQKPDDLWTVRLDAKLCRMAGLKLADFGTRRRFSYSIHEEAVRRMSFEKNVVGTSNVYFARMFGLLPMGTMAHEWVQAHAAMFGYRQANKLMMDAWVKEYEGNLGIALPDTYTSEIFFRDFSTLHAKLFDGVRWDSGDWKEFTDATIACYKRHRIDPTTKTIVFSDSLNDKSACEIAAYCKGKIRASFGIGTFITNDVGVKPLNMVIKMTECGGLPTVKLSDTPGKATGDPEAVRGCQEILGVG